MSEQIHIIDGQNDEILDIITMSNVLDDAHKKSLTDSLETYDFIARADMRYSAKLEKRNRLVIPDEDGSLMEFVIFEVDKYRDSEGHKVQVFAHGSFLELKKLNVIYPGEHKGSSSQHAGRTLDKTGWLLGIDEGSGSKTMTVENHTSPYEMLKRVAREFDLELRFRVEHNGRKITGRYVDMLERVGEWTGREVTFGKDLENIRRVEEQDIVTALVGLGPEDEDGVRMEVTVEDDDALQRWGWIDRHGELQHYIEAYEIRSERTEMTESEARQYTRTALNKRINTQVTYETTVLDLEKVPGMSNKKIRFGDTIKIKDEEFNPPLYLEARVFEQTRSLKRSGEKDIKLGDYIEYTEEEVNNIWAQLRDEIRNRVTKYDLYEYTYDKLTIDDKDETVFEDGKSFAEATGIKAEENAKDFAVEEDAKIKADAEEYADEVSKEEAYSALSEAKQYAVAKEVYEQQVDKIIADIEDRAPIEYVDGELRAVKDDIDDFNAEIEKKADGSTVYTISEVDNMINNTVSKTQYETDRDDIVTELESHGTRLGQNEEAIGLKADSSELDTVETELTRKIGNVEVKADEVTTSVSEVRADLDGLEIGGRNLVVGTTGTQDNGSGGVFTFDFNGEILEDDLGDSVTLSFKIKLSEGESEGRADFYFRDSGSVIEDMDTFIVTDKWTYHKATFTVSNDIIEKTDTLGFRANGRGPTDTFGFLLKEVQLEKGNRATDWTPAPEDVDGAISDVSGRVESLDAEIRTVAGEVSLKASQSVVDSLEGRVSTAEGELQVLPEQIEARVTVDEAESIFRQEADKFTFEADQINFDGHVFGGDATFTGKIEGAVVESSELRSYDDLDFVYISGGEIHVGEGLGRIITLSEGALISRHVDSSLPKAHIDGGSLFFEYYSSEVDLWYEGIRIDYNRISSDISLFFDPVSSFFETPTFFNDEAVFNNEVKINDSLTVEAAGVNEGIIFKRKDYADVSGHVITNHSSNDYLVIYPHRVSGQDIFRIRSHFNRADYRTDFRLNNRGEIISLPTKNNPVTWSGRLAVADNTGRFGYVSSSERFKIAIDKARNSPENILDIDPKTWYDKRNTEAYAELLTRRYNGEDVDFDDIDEDIVRIPGLIAEEVERAGLTDYVTYGKDGKVDGVQYDRLWTLLIPLVREQRGMIKDNVVEIEMLKERIKQLEEAE